jgi:Ca2+-binding EF-hand superfamily protein
MQTSTKASMKSIALKQPKKQNTWKQVKEVVLNPYEAEKINYTEDENYEAYKVFSIMDVDNSGCITIR